MPCFIPLKETPHLVTCPVCLEPQHHLLECKVCAASPVAGEGVESLVRHGGGILLPGCGAGPQVCSGELARALARIVPQQRGRGQLAVCTPEYTDDILVQADGT